MFSLNFGFMGPEKNTPLPEKKKNFLRVVKKEKINPAEFSQRLEAINKKQFIDKEWGRETDMSRLKGITPEYRELSALASGDKELAMVLLNQINDELERLRFSPKKHGLPNGTSALDMAIYQLAQVRDGVIARNSLDVDNDDQVSTVMYQ